MFVSFLVHVNIVYCIVLDWYMCVCRCKSKAVQTGVDVGLHYSWPRGSAEAVASTQYGLAFVEPSSVATAVVSADALEGM